MSNFISHIYFHITNNYFQGIEKETIKLGHYEQTASMWSLLMGGRL